MVLLGGAFVFWIKFRRSSSYPSPSPSSYQRQQLTFFKGLWPAPGDEDAFINSLEEIKKLGVNIVPVVASFCVKGSEIKPIVYGPPWLQRQQERIIKERITKIHQAGLAVELDLGTMSPQCEIEIQAKQSFINQFSEIVQKWAQIAEEYQVELFSPLNEPNLVLRGKESEFAQKVLPRIKGVYKGKVVLKVADTGPEKLNYSGYDYVAFDIYPQNLSEWERQLSEVAEKMEKLESKYALEGVYLGEFGALTYRDPNDPLLAGEVFSETEQAQILETAFRTLWSKTSGFFVMNWAQNSNPYNIRGKPAEEVLKKWFNKNR